MRSWINLLLVFVPAGIAAEAAGLSPAVIFSLNAVAIIPLAGLLTHATESVAMRCGDTIGALMNISLGNAVELILFIIALAKNEIRIVQAALLGSILSNLLLILGMAFFIGGMRYQEQIYNSTVTQMSACLLSLSVMSLLLPTAFHASFSDAAQGLADRSTLKISRGTSIVLLIVYILYLLFQLKSHAYMYESTPQHIIDEESHPGILADMMDTSSSSESSSSSDSDDTDTSGSHTTTRRIRKAFRNRRRRKSSVSSMHPSPLPSIVSSPSQEIVAPSWDSTPPTTAPITGRRLAALGAKNNSDDSNVDDQAHLRPGHGQTVVRDFVQTIDEEGSHGRPSKFRRSKSTKSKKKHRKGQQSPHSAQAQSKASSSTRPSATEPQAMEMNTIEHIDEQQAAGTTAGHAAKKGFLPGRQSFRPPLPKLLSHNVFVQPPPAHPMQNGAPVRPAMRRTSSLPDRLNATAPRPSQHENLPPYARQVRIDSGPGTQQVEVEDERPSLSRTSAIILLCISTGFVAVCAEFLVDAIPGMIDSTPVSQAFIGLIILPIVSNAAEHVTAVTVAARNKMDLAIGVSVGSSIQIALFVTPLVVILGWMMDRDMTLYFNLFETVSLFVTAFVVNFLVLDGRSNFLEGVLLLAAYIIIA